METEGTTSGAYPFYGTMENAIWRCLVTNLGKALAVGEFAEAMFIA